jgi:hypothetical protein
MLSSAWRLVNASTCSLRTCKLTTLTLSERTACARVYAEQLRSEHASKRNFQSRWQQIEELAEYVNTQAAQGMRYPVLIAGDLNVEALVRGKQEESDEYRHLMQSLHNCMGPGALDLLKLGELLCMYALTLAANDGKHPITYGDFHHDEQGERIAKETVLTAPCDWFCALRLDYVMWHPMTARSAITPSVAHTRVEPFFCDSLKFPFSQLSDHYAVSTILEVHDSKQ